MNPTIKPSHLFTGGPAFPGGISAAPSASSDAPPTQPGMDVRTLAALLAFHARLSTVEVSIAMSAGKIKAADVCEECCQWADWMILELNKTR